MKTTFYNLSISLTLSKVESCPNKCSYFQVGNFLEMTLIPDIDLRNATIPIFFDMMQGYVFSVL